MRKSITLLSLLVITAVTLVGADSTSKTEKNLAEQLKSSDVLLRRAAAEQIGKNEKADAAELSALTESLKDTDVMVRNHSAWALGKTAKSSPVAVQALIRALNDAEWSVRHNAALSLTWIGSSAVPELLKTVNGGKDRAGVIAASVIARSGKSREREVLPILAANLTSSDPEIRTIASHAFVIAGDDSLPYANQIAASLGDAVEDVRINALVALGSMGSKAKEHVPKELAVLKSDKKEAVRCAAATSLAKIDPTNESVIKELINLLAEKKERLPEALITALEKAGAAAVPELLKGLKQEDSEAKLLILDTIARIGAPAKEAAPMLVAILKHPQWEYRTRAAGALGNFGEGDKAVIQALKKAAEDSEETVRVQAIASLKKLEGHSTAPKG